MSHRTRSNSMSLFLMLLAMLGMLASCIKEDNAMGDNRDEIMIKLRAGTRAPGDNDPLIRDKDDHFSSLAVYVFDANGKSLALHKFSVGEEGVNSYTTTAFSCSLLAKNLFVIGNYADYPDLDEALVASLNKADVQKLVANAEGNVELKSTNILMVGEAALPAFSEDAAKDEHLEAEVTLHRLAARVDVFVFKEEGWDEDVQTTKVAFTGGVKNTTLTYSEEGDITLPSPVVYDSVREYPEDKSAAEDDGNMSWSDDTHLHGRFYTYRTSRPQNSEHAPRLAVTTLVNGVERTYSASIPNPDATGNMVLDAGKVYQVKAVLKTSGIQVEITVADWDEGGTYELEFAYPQYRQMTPFNGSSSEGDLYPQPTVYYNPDPASDAGTYSFEFYITGPVGQEWTPTLVGGTEADFRVEVLQGGTLVEAPYSISPAPYQIRVKALKPGNEGVETALGISCIPKWDTQSMLLLIGGSGENLKWEGSDMPELIKIKQVQP
ncbi:FimB/Mfa2 family fimbrial subunit [Bacteroides sp. KH569_7]|uniref:FimB/Mfa2 family fimbrial subunit n=1 Tax=Bacteroides muris (ex Fokt et al. 2023) TaxID=2937417 RepID=A0A9X2SYT1_9BACE|nr:fimbrial protein [Bacteroides muris (ex Fokt et al. 2023)]MCR6509522.1 FimB/Mfa2 family fimbrial subunit [Bacteroides muris (ex Fokt et al. 2023)]